MKLRKALVAKVLAAAVAITSVLPMGAMTANAAPVVRTEEETVKWMYTNENNNFVLKQEHWIDAKTGEAFEMFGKEFVLGDAIPTWHFNSLTSDENGHGDLSVAGAAGSVYASKIDIKSQGVRRVMQFDLTQLNEAELRFGVMLKYVDKDHWIFFGQNGGKNNTNKIPYWGLEWKNGTDGGYCDVGNNYTATDGSTKKFDPSFKKLHLGKEKWNSNPDNANNQVDVSDHIFADNLRITVTYENAGLIKVRMAELEYGEDQDGNRVLQEKGDALEQELDFKMFADLRTSAGEKPIHFGFIGGTFNNELTDVNIMNVRKGALKENEDEWSEAMSDVVFESCGWKSPKTEDASVYIQSQKIGEGTSYASIGDPDNVSMQSPDATIYNDMITDFAEGTVTADLRPYEVGEGKEFYLGVIGAATSSSPQAAGGNSFRIGINHNKWVYNVNGTEKEISGEALPEIKEKTDYTINMSIDNNGNVLADLVTGRGTDEEKKVSVIKASDCVNVKGLSGSVSLTAKGAPLRVKHVFCDQISYNKTPLENTYNDIIANNLHNEFYKDEWAKFSATSQTPGKLGEAWNALNGEHKDKILSLSPQSAENDGWTIYDALFDADKATELQNAFNTFNVSANKVAAGKASLQAEFDKAITPENPDAVKWYTPESLEEYKATWESVRDFLASLVLDENFQGVNKTEVTAKEDAIKTADSKLVRKSADEAYINENLVPAITAALDGIDDREDENNAKYYNNWADFIAAVEEAEALKTKENPTIEEVDEAIRALRDAKANLTLKTVTSLTEYTSQIEEMSGDTITEEYYKGDFAAYTTALEAARGIKVGDTVKDADAKMNDLKAAFAGISLKTLADDTEKANELKSEVSAVKAEVAAKKYVKDEKWAEYETALAEVEGMLANAESTILDVVNAVAALKDAKDALTVDTTPDQKPDPTPDNKPAPPQPEVKDPAVGTPYTDAATGMKYKVGANLTVELTEGNKSSKKVTVNAVTIEGKSYKVTSIAANAFKGAKMTTLTIGDNVTTINKNAFNNCKALKTVTIGKNVKSIKANAFGKCKKINSVTFKGTKKLPTIKNAFKGANTKPKTIKVKKALIKKASQKTKVLKQLKAAGFKKITAKNIKGVK